MARELTRLSPGVIRAKQMLQGFRLKTRNLAKPDISTKFAEELKYIKPALIRVTQAAAERKVISSKLKEFTEKGRRIKLLPKGKIPKRSGLEFTRAPKQGRKRLYPSLNARWKRGIEPTG